MYTRRNILYVLIIVSLLIALFTGRAFFFNISYLLGGLLILSFLWSFASVRGLGLGRKTRSRHAQVGQPIEETITVKNRSLLPKLLLEVRDYSDLPGHRASQAIPALGMRQSFRWTVTTPCVVRGEFTLGPMEISSGDPFGFFTSPRPVNAITSVIVYPRTVPVTRFDLPMGMLAGGEAQRRRAQTVTTNAAGVRDYVVGDSFNRIHWASSARKDRLIVKEFEIDPTADIWVFADFSSASLAEAPGLLRVNGDGAALPRSLDQVPPSSEEYTVVAAASLARFFIEAERALGFAAYVPHREIYQPERGSRQLTHILGTLAVARSTATYSLAEMLTLETPYLTRGTTLLIVTSSLDTAWINEAQLLARKGIRPACILIDPFSFGNERTVAFHTVAQARAMLRLAKIPHLIVRNGDDVGAALAQGLAG